MSNLGPYVTFTVDDLDAVMEDYTSVRLYRASSQTGTYSLLTTLTLVADQPAYSYQDTAGAATDWYRHSFYTASGPTESQQSEPYPAQNAPIISRTTLRQRAADRLGLYGRPRRQHTFPGAFTTTAAGSSTTTVCSAFTAARWSTAEFVDAFLLATSGTESGNERQISVIAGASGTFTHDAFATGVGSGATFEVYRELASGEWNELIDLARDSVWLPFDFAIGGVASAREYALPYWIEYKEQVTGASVQTGDTIREHQLSPIILDYLDDRQGGGVVFRATIPTNQVWILHGFRQPPPFLADSDTVVLAENLQDLWIDAVCMRACERLSERASGTHPEDRSRWSNRALLYAKKLPPDPPWRISRPIRSSRLVAVAGGRRGGREIHSAFY